MPKFVKRENIPYKANWSDDQDSPWLGFKLSLIQGGLLQGLSGAPQKQNGAGGVPEVTPIRRKGGQRQGRG